MTLGRVLGGQMQEETVIFYTFIVKTWFMCRMFAIVLAARWMVRSSGGSTMDGRTILPIRTRLRFTDSSVKFVPEKCLNMVRISDFPTPARRRVALNRGSQGSSRPKVLTFANPSVGLDTPKRIYTRFRA
jgi:hypothetical protein